MEYTLMAIKYNNYYNRQLKIELTKAAYLKADENPYYEEHVYFKFGDNVNTTQVVNNNVEDKDYVVLLADDGSIHSRWFIIDSDYQLNEQQVLTLRRDVAADLSHTVLYSDSFIEKGYLRSGNNLLFNKEQMTFNQVKKEEYLLKDSTNIPWIVGYYPNNIQPSGTAKLPNTEYDEVVSSDFSNWAYSGLVTCKPSPNSVKYNFIIASRTFDTYTLSRIGTGEAVGVMSDASTTEPRLIVTPQAGRTYIQRQLYYGMKREKYYDSLLQQDGVATTDKDSLMYYNNKRVKFNDGIYIISVKENNPVLVTGKATVGTTLITSMFTDIQKCFPSDITVSTIGVTNQWLTYSYDAPQLSVTGEKSPQGEYTYAINQNHYTLSDAPYSMFCMPYGSLVVSDGTTTIRTDKDIQLAVATNMAETSGNTYDIQILPYCPLTEIKGLQYTVTDTRAYDIIKEGETIVGYIFHCQRSSFSKRISILPIPQWLTKRSDPVDVKVQNECEFIRFNSPNYASSWEMSVAKNEGISWINVAATYKPYSPYIKIYPDFKGLYGDDFNDQRGLILSGDFSIPVISDQWKTYELNNKNYQSMFDREIKNLNVQQKYGKLQDILETVTGAFGAAGTGAALGSALGPVGSIAGGALSAGASAAAGIGDITINDKLRDEAKSYKMDMYGYQLGNIKALPNTLTKTSAYNIDNKYFPFIEHYSATDVEIEAFKNKLKYNGMTVGVIGRFADYLGEDETYVKGQLIRLESVGDMHLANQLALEMAKGVYINGSITAIV